MKKLDQNALCQRGVELFMSGFNCAQAVYGAFAPVLGLDEKEALRLASPFGGGFGRMREVCGAFSGMMLVVGNLYGYDSIDHPEKDALYPRVQELGRRFREQFGSLVCRDLLEKKAEVGGAASPRTPEYYAARPCARFVEGACRILAEYLEEENYDQTK